MMAAKRCFAIVQARAQEDEHAAGGVTAMARDCRLFGFCEFFLATEGLDARCAATPRNKPSEAMSALRATHVSMYYRSTLATEVGNWEVLAALGEFYRLIGCPEWPPSEPAPDMATAMSYFEQAKAMTETSAFVQDRLDCLAERAAEPEEEDALSPMSN